MDAVNEREKIVNDAYKAGKNAHIRKKDTLKKVGDQDSSGSGIGGGS